MYKGVKQQKIYNLKTRKIYILNTIWFNKSLNYDNNGYKVTNKDNNSTKLSDR